MLGVKIPMFFQNKLMNNFTSFLVTHLLSITITFHLVSSVESLYFMFLFASGVKIQLYGGIGGVNEKSLYHFIYVILLLMFIIGVGYYDPTR